MSHELSAFESDLQRLRAAPLDAALLERLDACTANTWTRPDPAATSIEQHLQQFTPAPLPPALLARLEAATRTTPFSGDQNIVRFPHAPTTATTSRRTWWSAAAAVALAGGAAALLIPTSQELAPTSSNVPEPRVTQPVRDANKLIPAGFNRNLAEARDEGVVWQSNKEPHRVLKVVYMERVTLKDASGRTYQVDKPRVEYILVPAGND